LINIFLLCIFTTYWRCFCQREI